MKYADISYRYSQWNPPQSHSSHSTSYPTPTFPQVSNSMSPYHSNIQTAQPLQDIAAGPAVSAHASSLGPPPSRHFFSPSSLSEQFDSNPRPAKSPRSTELSSSSLYQSFDAPCANGSPGNSSGNRLYYPHTPAPEPWSSAEAAASNYATTLHHPSHQSISQQTGQQQRHQPQSTQNYNYHSETYVTSRNDDQNLGYTWSTSG